MFWEIEVILILLNNYKKNYNLRKFQNKINDFSTFGKQNFQIICKKKKNPQEIVNTFKGNFINT